MSVKIEFEKLPRMSKPWVIRRRIGPWSPDYNRNSGRDYEYWNGSWSLSAFRYNYAISFKSETAARVYWMTKCLEE